MGLGWFWFNSYTDLAISGSQGKTQKNLKGVTLEPSAILDPPFWINQMHPILLNEPIYMRVGYVLDLSFLEWKIQPISMIFGILNK